MDNRDTGQVPASMSSAAYQKIALKRADWRFLLGNTNPRKSIVFGDGILADAVDMISESTVVPREGHHGDVCDLAVVAKPDNKTLEAAWSFLKPGGSVYVEWILNPFSRTKHIQTRLEEIGFRDIRFYLLKPAPFRLQSKMWVPIGKKRIINYLLRRSNINKSENTVKKVAVSIRRLIWSFSPKLFIDYPWLISSDLTKFVVCAVASKPMTTSVVKLTTNTLQEPNSKTCESADSIPDVIEACMTKLNLQQKSNNTSILLQSGADSKDKVLLLIFLEMDSEPAFVIKMNRIEGLDSSVTNGVRMLSIINEKFNNINGIPNILYSDLTSGLCTVGETFISGIQISKAVNKSNYEELALKATSWLIDFAIKTKTTPSNGVYDYIVEPELKKLEVITNLLLSPEQNQLTQDLIARLELSSVVCEHGDFAPQNVHISSNGGLGVLDWDKSRLYGLPAFDLIFFLTYLNFHLHQAWSSTNFINHYREMLDNSTFTGSIFKKCLDLYRDSVGITAQTMDSLRLLTWVSRSLRYLQSHAVNRQEIENIKNGFHYSLWMQELRHLKRKLHKYDVDKTHLVAIILYYDYLIDSLYLI